jgi:hypothetical protein
MKTLGSIAITLAVLLLGYGIVGTSGRVAEIKREAPAVIKERGWEIMRYEGYQFGSFAHHGGKVWYHVKDKTNPHIQYRVYICKWGGELHFYYNAPETLSRIQITE